ncbi:hypothetical protein FNW52_19480 [Flavobacterium sp. ZT3R18]|uniref:hypothetical protein n=1 Tax=Flavobacterium sp. ZT3R18 TaxID=2594429 RepID=UPI00117B66CB|nr:hypothetical protein [Flavobacterium sp. ZT3R18]TRX30897.1 hypothetical protein FNW52_19480 [Flavobacterium sp. ZT3R18]
MSESILTTNYFEVANTAHFRIKELEYKTSCTYKIFIENFTGQNCNIRLYEIKYITKGLRFKSSQTHVKMTVDSLFDYVRTLSIIAKQ